MAMTIFSHDGIILDPPATSYPEAARRSLEIIKNRKDAKMPAPTPRDIISKNICGIEGIRIPFAKIIVENILQELKEEGYLIIEERELRTPMKKEI